MDERSHYNRSCMNVRYFTLIKYSFYAINEQICNKVAKTPKMLKQLETKLSIIKTKCTNKKKSLSDTLTLICRENKITFQKLKKMFYDLKSVTDASNVRAEVEIVKSMYLARENTTMKLELFEFRRKGESHNKSFSSKLYIITLNA